MYSDRKQISDCLGTRELGEWVITGTRKLLEVMEMFIILIMITVSGECTHFKLIKLYTLNMCDLFYANYASIML